MAAATEAEPGVAQLGATVLIEWVQISKHFSELCGHVTLSILASRQFSKEDANGIPSFHS